MADEQDLKIRVTVTGETTGAKQAEDALKGVKNAAGGAAEGAAKAAKAAKHLGTEVKELSKLGHEAEGVLTGLERGGVSGLAQAGRSLAGIIRTLGTGALGAVLIPAVVAATAAIKILNAIAEKNKEVMQGMWDAAAARSNAYKETVAKNTAELNKFYDDQKKKLAELVAEYNELDAAIDRSTKRAEARSAAKRESGDAKADLQKQTELAATTDPAAKAAIEAKYAAKDLVAKGERSSIDLQNKDLTNSLKSDALNQEIDKARGVITAAKTPVNQAQREFGDASEAADLAHQVSGRIASDPTASDREKRSAEEAATDATRVAAAAQQKVKAAEDKFYETAKDAMKVIEEATAKLADIKNETDVDKTKQETAKTDTAAKAIPALVDTLGKKDALQKTAVEAQQKGDFETQGKAVQELKSIGDTAELLNKAIGEHAPAVASALKQSAKDLDSATKQIKDQREKTGGG